MKTIILNQKGFSLVEALVAASVIVVAFSAADYANLLQNNALEGVDKSNIINAKADDLAEALAPQVSCTANLAGLDMGPSPVPSPTKSAIAYYDDTSTRTGWALQVVAPTTPTKMTPSNITVVPGPIIGTNLQMGMVQVTLAGSSAGLGQVRRSIPIKMWMNGTVIDHCMGASVPSGGSGSTCGGSGQPACGLPVNYKRIIGSTYDSSCPTGWVLNKGVNGHCGVLVPSGWDASVGSGGGGGGTAMFSDGIVRSTDQSFGCTEDVATCHCFAEVGIDTTGMLTQVVCQPL